MIKANITEYVFIRSSNRLNDSRRWNDDHDIHHVCSFHGRTDRSHMFVPATYCCCQTFFRVCRAKSINNDCDDAKQTARQTDRRPDRHERDRTRIVPASLMFVPATYILTCQTFFESTTATTQNKRHDRQTTGMNEIDRTGTETRSSVR